MADLVWHTSLLRLYELGFDGLFSEDAGNWEKLLDHGILNPKRWDVMSPGWFHPQLESWKVTNNGIFSC